MRIICLKRKFSNLEERFAGLCSISGWSQFFVSIIDKNEFLVYLCLYEVFDNFSHRTKQELFLSSTAVGLACSTLFLINRCQFCVNVNY